MKKITTTIKIIGKGEELKRKYNNNKNDKGKAVDGRAREKE